uniref:Uncharacterized protein n=1 Tax=Eucampia antarctica TaxID=49252 RepID=A0A7S2S604_9STRA|mmetsp:Transcript_3132/g.3016  ORF Transcript_3132/g.3016 Transcript_3132/m.3016 type:complete len:494 (+) Transcript_3132:38-1519(+)|eukprot:CAMPEP_0197831814 /NCGR_PEP_ID=MMETSP1437-20131217/12234_1 /TAXON_ID=49252 ORGANISM="Eucampia antarctica, Strain CCMP1452" /NCGR_SAMPLE_ID=MMETSP1437 /ASSEMBLY_ACC=CAM_ASM_001096 /LENGTH=493 /DNA_ID=CAMNT_0043434893 /DNA_START=38 /DNA_END=1519 /DNA_ORIENTATION=+
MIERYYSRYCRVLATLTLFFTLCGGVLSSTSDFGLNNRCIGCSHRINLTDASKAGEEGLSSIVATCRRLRGGSSEEGSEDEIYQEIEDESDESTDDESDEESGGIKVTSPLKLLIRTNLIGGSNAIDISPAVELMCTRTRSILSIKQSLSRSLRGRPPLDLLQLVDSRTGQTLSDQVLVQELADDDEDEDEDEDDPQVTLYLDMVPPVDPKFGTLLPEQLAKASTQQLLDMYAANVASMHANSHALFLLSQDEDESLDQSHIRVVWNMKQHAMTFKQHILSNLLTEEQQQLLQNERKDTEIDGYDADSLMDGDVMLKESLKRKGRKNGVKGGATMHVKRALQKNLNINWPDTIRNFFLFLFFGYFGGRSVFSRSVMLLGAPMCFFLQLRPVKIMLKQLFYAIGQPPGIFLSLLAAPQQAIMSLNYNAAMRDLYGEHATNDMMPTTTEDIDDYSDDDLFNNDLASFSQEEDSEESELDDDDYDQYGDDEYDDDE